MKLIETITVGSGGAASVTFNSIPQTYTDLVVVANARHTSGGGDNLIAQLNGTTTSYVSRYLGGTGTAVQNYTNSSLGISSGMLMGNVGGTSYTSNTWNASTIHIPNYTETVTKTGVANGGFENAASSVGYQSLTVSSSSVTAAVTSVTVKASATNLAENSVISLYGILKGSGGATVS